MKAAIVEKPGVLAVRDIPMPDFSEYEALCELLYGATCTGTDLHIISGHANWGFKLPAVLGHESVGRVIKVGKKVRNLKVGDVIAKVWTKPTADGKVGICYGGFAEFGVACDFRVMEEAGLKFNRKRVEMHIPLPEGFDPKAATMIITWRETLSYLSRMGDMKGKSVLVIGSGGNGLAFGVHAKNLGAGKVAMLGSSARKDIAVKAGFDLYFDYRQDALKTSGELFDYIIDSVGKIGQMDKALCVLKNGGVIGIYGLDDEGKVTINPVNAKGTFTVYNNGYDDSDMHGRVVEFVEQGKLDARIWMDLDNPYPLNRIADAFEAVKNRKAVKSLIKLH